ncbi:hypothetical protein RBTH_07538 [Bacillus thuringiensis serovar israelensis ATCC 35646]|nr:hypothetical protein RBTH_07538 [Bacillus thuringiensis serovar israelensis ATCC 35646]
MANSQSSLEGNKVVIFTVTEDNLTIFGESATVGAITEFEKSDFNYSSKNTGDMFKVKTKELLNFLNTFTIDRTMPTKVTFDLVEGTNGGGTLTLTVHEEPLEGQPSYLENDSHWVFDTTPISKATLENMNILDGEQVVASPLLKIYIEALLPLLNNADANMNDSKINFEEKYAYVFSSKTFALFQNKLPECLKGIVLGYEGIVLLKQLTSEYDQILVSKYREKGKIFITAGTNRISIKFNEKMLDYKRMMETLTVDNYFTVDRKMFTSVINRLTLTKDNTTMSLDLENEVLALRSKKFSQNIPISNYSGADLKDFNINVVTGVLKDSVLGDDAQYSDDLVIRVTRSSTAWTVTFTDPSNMWLCVFRTLAKK